MFAGLPGLGLGGFFFVLSALAAPLLELPRLARGQSSAGAWREIARNVVISLLIVAMVDFALRVAYVCTWLLGDGSADRLNDLTVLPAGPMALTLLLLATVLATAKFAQLGLRSSKLIGDRRARHRRRLVHGPSCPCCTD
jgi:hypothetical protein